MDLGGWAYAAYCKQTGGRSLVTGDALPKWDALKPEIRLAWSRAADEVARLVRDQERRRAASDAADVCREIAAKDAARGDAQIVTMEQAARLCEREILKRFAPLKPAQGGEVRDGR